MYNDFGRAQSSAEVEVRPGPEAPPRPPPPPEQPPPMTCESRSISSMEMEEKRSSSQVRGFLPKVPSKFQKADFSDYESDCTTGLDSSSRNSGDGAVANKIQFLPKWRPYHSDTEDLVDPPKYRSVKPKLKELKKRPVKDQLASPAGPHQWESHADIENLQKELRKKQPSTLVSSSSSLQSETKTVCQTWTLTRNSSSSMVKPRPRRAKSTDLESQLQVPKQNLDSKKFYEEEKVPKQSTASLPIRIEDKKKSGSKREFISVKEKAKLLEEMVNSYHQADYTEDETSKAVTSEVTSLKPQEIPGAVRVLPPAKGQRSASANIFQHHHQTLTLTRNSSQSMVKPRPRRAKSTDLELQLQVPKQILDSKKFSEEEKVLEQRSLMLHGLPHHQLLHKEESLRLHHHEGDSPPTIEMTATRCEGGETDASSKTTDYGGYEADTENTLKKGQKKDLPMFQPTKFVPRLAQDSHGSGSPIWKPRNNIL